MCHASARLKQLDMIMLKNKNCNKCGINDGTVKEVIYKTYLFEFCLSCRIREKIKPKKNRK